MIGITGFEYCKEKAMGIIADQLWILAIIIGAITGVIQGELLDYCIRENSVIGKLKYMNVFEEKPSIYSNTGIEDYQILESYTPIRVYSFY